MKHRFNLIRNLMISAWAINSGLNAQDSIAILDPTVVVATRSSEALSELPYTASLLEQSFLENRQFRTLPDVFQEVPGVLVQKTAHGHGSPYIRNFTGRQNLLLVDGIRMNNSTWRSGPVQYWNTFDRENLSSIEVIKGQGSVLYGSDAIGGTVSLQSKSSGFRQESVGLFYHGRGLFRYDSNSRSRVGRIEHSFGFGGQWGAQLGVSVKDFGDIKDSAVGRMRKTGYQEQGLDFKFEAALSESVTLTLAHQQLNQDDVWRWHNTIFNPGWTHGSSVTSPGGDTARIYDQERSLSYLRLSGENEQSWLDSWQATLSYQTGQDSNFRDRSNSGRAVTSQALDLETWGFDFQMESKLGSGSLVYGIDYYRDEVSSAATSNGVFDPALRPIADDSSYDLLGLFAQYQWRPLEKFEMHGGLRYSRAKARWERNNVEILPGVNQDLPGDGSWDDLSLSLRGLVEVTEELSLFGGVSQAFRAPNLNDLTGQTFSLNGLSSSGSVELDPEKFWLTELGVRWEGERLFASFSGYYTVMDGQIVAVDDGFGALSSVNGGDGHVYGFELETNWRINRSWSSRLWAAWQDGRTEQPLVLGGPLSQDLPRRLHPIMGGLSLRWQDPDRPYWAEARVTFAAKADKLASAAANDTQRIPAGGTPAYIIPSIYGGWQLTESIALTMGVENLSNEDYRLHGSGQNEPGFNVITGIEMTW